MHHVLVSVSELLFEEDLDFGALEAASLAPAAAVGEKEESVERLLGWAVGRARERGPGGLEGTVFGECEFSLDINNWKKIICKRK